VKKGSAKPDEVVSATRPSHPGGGMKNGQRPRIFPAITEKRARGENRNFRAVDMARKKGL